jgi:hypothetical protein
MNSRCAALSLPRMADFALRATACESAFRPAGTLDAAYSNNRREAIENIVDADPVAAHVREVMADRALVSTVSQVCSFKEKSCHAPRTNLNRAAWVKAHHSLGRRAPMPGSGAT